MKTYVHRHAILLSAASVFFLLLTVCAFGAASEPNSVSAEPAPAKSQPLAEPNKSAETVPAPDSVAVTVNGVDIMESQIDEQLKPQLQKMASQLPPQFVEQYKKQLRQQVVERIIIEKL